MDLQELLKGCEKFDKNSQHELFEIFKNSMKGICIRYSRNEEQANEMLREGFVNVFNNVRNIPSAQQMESWVKATIIDTAIEILRRNKQEYKIVSTVNAYDNITHQDRVNDTEVVRSMDFKDVLKAMQALTPAYRVVVNMHLVDGYTLRHVSEKLDVGEATIRLNYEKAMHQLRRNIVQLTTVSHAE